MTTLPLAPDEIHALEQTLERSVSDLATELGHTDSHEYKEMLKRRKRTLEGLLQKVRAAAVPA
jgi:hypothetical protein